MAIAIGIALFSIVLGAGLGLLPGTSSRAANPFRTFAMVTAVAVVLGQLLPEALGAIGIPALLAFGAGFAAPRLAERAALAMRKPACSHDDAMCTDLGLEFGYIGLLLHQVGDGIGLGLYAGPLHRGHDHFDVLAALASHTIPITALLVLAFKTHRGALSAALRAGGIALATVLGVWLANLFGSHELAHWEPWLTAAVGGLLLHIVAHGWPKEAHATASSRLIDFAAIAAGLAIVTLGGHSHAHDHGHPDMRHAMGDALLELSLETAPTLLLGLGVAALLQTQGARIPARWLNAGGRLGQALRGAVIGLPLPVCACGILPVAHSLWKRGGAAALIVAFLLATPELGVDSLALTIQFFGWEFAVLRLVAALLVAVVTGLTIAHFATPSHVRADPGSASPFAAPAGNDTRMSAQIVTNFDELLYHIGAWTLVGLLAAAYLQAAITDGSLSVVAGKGLDILLVSALAIPSYVCASSATPLGAVLLAKGFSPGAVLTGLLLGPATNLATLAWLRGAYGKRAALWGMVATLGVTWCIALLTNWLMPVTALLPVTTAHAHEHGMFAQASAALLCVLFARAVWRNGLRSWLGSLGETLSLEPQEHAHDHAHAHAHHEHQAHGTGSP